jgi:F0F1-type ATP synthase membrane subunit b/b'
MLAFLLGDIMLFETLILLILAGTTTIFIGIPLFKMIRDLRPKRKDALTEAKQRVEQARLALEAARLNKEAEKTSKEADKIYEALYEEALEVFRRSGRAP